MKAARIAAWVSPRVAAELTGLDPAEVNRLVEAGVVRREAIHGRGYVALADVDSAVIQKRTGRGLGPGRFAT